MRLLSFIALSAVVHVVGAAPCAMSDVVELGAAENKASFVIPMMATKPECASCFMGCSTAPESEAQACAIACAQDKLVPMSPLARAPLLDLFQRFPAVLSARGVFAGGPFRIRRSGPVCDEGRDDCGDAYDDGVSLRLGLGLPISAARWILQAGSSGSGAVDPSWLRTEVLTTEAIPSELPVVTTSGTIPAVDGVPVEAVAVDGVAVAVVGVAVVDGTTTEAVVTTSEAIPAVTTTEAMPALDLVVDEPTPMMLPISATGAETTVNTTTPGKCPYAKVMLRNVAVRLATLWRSNGVGEQDLACFDDWLYDCNKCCATGVNNYGNSYSASFRFGMMACVPSPRA
jgi:hypothetical protein